MTNSVASCFILYKEKMGVKWPVEAPGETVGMETSSSLPPPRPASLTTQLSTVSCPAAWGVHTQTHTYTHSALTPTRAETQPHLGPPGREEAGGSARGWQEGERREARRLPAGGHPNRTDRPVSELC